jgi:TonB family protein
MKAATFRLIGVAAVFATIALPSVARAQDALDSVRELYASAEYEGALSAIVRLKEDPVALGNVEIERYRVLCLYALGRAGEADAVIQAIITKDPMYEPAAAEAPPRIRAAFADVRRRVLPGIVRSMYAEAKETFDRKAFADAIVKLETTVRVIDSVDLTTRPELVDLRTLATGFLDLSRASLAPVVTTPKLEMTPAATRALEARAAAQVLTTDPVIVRQVLPPWSLAVAGALFNAEFRGVIEVDIDEHGNVVAAQITKPVHPAYDPVLLKAAQEWKYQPAQRAGVPVRVRKRVDVVLRPR